jgi:HAD superfamily hydrolase (TIGR01509 family)
MNPVAPVTKMGSAIIFWRDAIAHAAGVQCYTRRVSEAKPYRALLFDVMGTLVYDPFFEEVPAALGMSLDELIKHKHPTAWLEFETGAIDEKALEAKFFADGRVYPHQRMKAAMVEAYAWLEGTEQLLIDLVTAGVQLHLLSNYACWYHLIEEKLRISRYAKWSFVSCDTGARKPDPEAYLGPARSLGIDPSELLFIDDRGGNCKAAAQVGMGAIKFVGAQELRDELVALRVL